MEHGKDGHYKPVPPGHLWQEIKDIYENAPAGEYYAVMIKVENPITGYRVLGLDQQPSH